MLTQEEIDKVNEECKNTMFDNLGIKLIPSPEANIVIAQMEVNNRTSQLFGFLNGGASLALAENVAGLASLHLCKHNSITLGMNVSGTHVSPAKLGDTVTATATLVHQGVTMHLWNVDIHSSDGRLVSTVRVTNAIRKQKDIQR